MLLLDIPVATAAHTLAIKLNCKQVGHLPVKQQLGFTVKDAGFQLAHPFSPVTIQEASSAEESGETESWALPARWIPPSSQGPSEQDASATSSDQPTDTGFKGFKDCCEAGSFTLAGAQVADSAQAILCA